MELITYLEQAEYWHWWVGALVLMIMEITLFGAFFLIWIGVAAVVVGALLLILPDMGWQYQLLIWAVLSFVSLFGWHKHRTNNPTTSDEPLLNRRGEQYVGRVFTLEEPVINGQGKIKVDDSMWKIKSPKDLDTGTKVKVTEVIGTSLKVESA